MSPLHPTVRSGVDTVTHAVIRVRAAPRPETAKRPRLSAVLVLDVSGSMQGEPLAQVLQSAKRLAEILDDTDRLGVVTFSAGTKTISPLVPLSQGRRAILAALPGIVANSGTNIAGGLAEAALLFSERERGERQVALLLSDGAPTLGATTPAALGEMGRKIKERDIAISTLGYGAHHKPEVLTEIAESSGGRYMFVVDPKLAETSFIRSLGAALDVVAEHVEVLLEPGDGVEIVRVLDDPKTAVSRRGLKVSLPDVIVGDERNVVVELRVRARRDGQLPLLNVVLAGKRAGDATAFESAAELGIVASETSSGETDHAAHAVVNVLLAAEMRDRARALADRGSFMGAEAELVAAQALLSSTPGFRRGDGSALADAYETLADEIRVMQRKPGAQEYARYSLAARDHSDFAMSGAKPRGGGKLTEAPPSSRMLLARAQAGQVMPRAFLRVISGPRAGVRAALTSARFVIGRAEGAVDLMLPDADVSRQHSVIELVDGSFWLVDMGSTNGPMIDGRRITRHLLAHGDEFAIGESLIRYEIEPSDLN